MFVCYQCHLITGYYIASGVIVGCMVFAVVVLTVIIFFCCYMYQANEDHIKIDVRKYLYTIIYCLPMCT